MAKERLDVFLVTKGLVASREKAKRIIMAGEVLVNGQRIDKAGTVVENTSEIRLLSKDLPFVSRGGLKLAKAIPKFGIVLRDKIAADIGASTGGFTDCMLQNGAVRVYAIDVGYGQLAWKLRSDERVINMERTNIRYVEPEMIGELVDFASIDVAFISLIKVLPAVQKLMKPQGEMVALIKPQFEAGRENVGKHGVVKNPKVHEMVAKRVLEFVRNEGMIPLNFDFSPIKGPEGNIEYLLHIGMSEKDEAEDMVSDAVMLRVIKEAHDLLDS